LSKAQRVTDSADRRHRLLQPQSLELAPQLEDVPVENLARPVTRCRFLNGRPVAMYNDIRYNGARKLSHWQDLE
jgi:hypothetical protein